MRLVYTAYRRGLLREKVDTYLLSVSDDVIWSDWSAICFSHVTLLNRVLPLTAWVIN